MTYLERGPQSQKSCLIECDLTLKKKHKHTYNIEEDKQEEWWWSSDHYAQKTVKTKKKERSPEQNDHRIIL